MAKHWLDRMDAKRNVNAVAKSIGDETLTVMTEHGCYCGFSIDEDFPKVLDYIFAHGLERKVLQLSQREPEAHLTAFDMLLARYGHNDTARKIFYESLLRGNSDEAANLDKLMKDESVSMIINGIGEPRVISFIATPPRLDRIEDTLDMAMALTHPDAYISIIKLNETIKSDKHYVLAEVFKFAYLLPDANLIRLTAINILMHNEVVVASNGKGICGNWLWANIELIKWNQIESLMENKITREIYYENRPKVTIDYLSRLPYNEEKCNAFWQRRFGTK